MDTRSRFAIASDKINEINFETQDAMYQLSLAESTDVIEDIKERFMSFLERFVESISKLAADAKQDVIRVMRKACNMFANMYKARIAALA